VNPLGRVGSLDSRISEEIMEIFDRLSRAGTTVILVTHEPEIAEYSHRPWSCGMGGWWRTGGWGEG
jgi:ABC-type lipoprotein export system ATPase subunit